MLCACYRFSLHIQEKDEMELRPVFTEDGITFVYIKVRCLLWSIIYFIQCIDQYRTVFCLLFAV